ncbi:PEPxxWA-CTERM sorting domain-containing protein [Sphingomonas sp. 1P06PA]|uniref:PEPxxWA-CTERM sorting domain-containing protein n=1 Tax=Sphingomonas sp. 1P06PA TaxID=554121 RepID=UPI0039A68010
MTKFALLALAGAVAALPAAPASAVLINFDDLAEGTTLSTQYAAQGVTFSPNAFSGAGGPTGDWATNTDMTIVSASGSDVGGLGTPSLVSGNLLRSFNGWLGEDGDASFAIDFTAAASAVSLDFAGVTTPSSTQIFAYNGSTLIGSVAGSTGGQFTLSFAAPSITRLVVTPGDFFDWVGVDNLNFTLAAGPAVPEPASWALMIGGFGLIGGAMRRQRVHVAYAA